MEKLITEINKLGHNVQLYQYGNWLVNRAGRWEASATNTEGKAQTGFAFGQTPIDALTKLRDKIKGWKAKDPFEDDDEDKADQKWRALEAEVDEELRREAEDAFE